MIPYVPARLLKLIKFFFVILVIYIAFFTSAFRMRDSVGPRFRPQHVPTYVCPSSLSGSVFTHFDNFSSVDASLTESRILLILENANSRHGRLIMNILNATKCHYKMDTFFNSIPSLTTSFRGRYSSIIIENFNRYLNYGNSRAILDKYSREFKAPIISFLPSRAQYFTSSKIKESNITIWHNQKAFNARFSSSSAVPFIARPESTLAFPDAAGREWTLFEESASHESILVVEDGEGRRRAAAIRDRGSLNGVEKIILGHNLTDWLIGLAFLDSVRWSTKSRCSIDTLDRFIQIDIDDVFVGARGTRMVPEDVEALIQSQQSLRRHIDKFSYLLGFSGAYFDHGDDLEDEGDRMLIEKADNFMWFPHMWKHNHVQDYNESSLEATMQLNKQFAKENNLNVPFNYAISPQHAGVYPVHKGLYEAWKKVWNVEVTSTEEYPHFRPSSARRGFTHAGIKVLPRQTCGLYTHTQFFHLYPGGLKKLTAMIEGGDLFWTIVLNPMSIFMTHQQNYAHDRLAPYTFESALAFLECWTRLRFRWQDPIRTAQRYFDTFPREKNPVWSNACRDDRHLSIMPPSFNCSNLTLPNLLIVGPQKTGSTALSSFLQLHPNVSGNRLLEKSFEEVQFFSGENYAKGFEWYASLFTNASVVVDKSATYFDSTEGAVRAASLMPSAKIVIILHDPILRAWSWFNHLVARNESIVFALSMDDVIDAETPAAKKIRSRCISGGRYAYHLEKWLEWFPPTQLYLVDGAAFKDQPAQEVAKLSSWLRLPPFDYASSIKFNPKKGFHCKVVEGRASCLGASKGRSYPAISPILSSRLCSFFLTDNLALHKFLLKHKISVPSWLDSSLQCP